MGCGCRHTVMSDFGEHGFHHEEFINFILAGTGVGILCNGVAKGDVEGVAHVG